MCFPCEASRLPAEAAVAEPDTGLLRNSRMPFRLSEWLRPLCFGAVFALAGSLPLGLLPCEQPQPFSGVATPEGCRCGATAVEHSGGAVTMSCTQA